MTSWNTQHNSSVVDGDDYRSRNGMGKGNSRGSGLFNQFGGYGHGSDDVDVVGNFVTREFTGFEAPGRAGCLYFFGDDENGAGAAYGRGEGNGKGSADVIVDVDD